MAPINTDECIGTSGTGNCPNYDALNKNKQASILAENARKLNTTRSKRPRVSRRRRIANRLMFWKKTDTSVPSNRKQ